MRFRQLKPRTTRAPRLAFQGLGASRLVATLQAPDLLKADAERLSKGFVYKNLVLYHGVLAARARWRARVVAYRREAELGTEREGAAAGAARGDSAISHRLREARFPELKTLDTFDFTATDGSVGAAQIAELARGEWIARAANIILAGPIGTGKTHLAIALGVEAARQRHRVLFTRAADVVRSLLEARDARELGRLQKRLQQVDLLILDELGFVPFERAGGELLFSLLTERYERRSVIVTTNLAFGEWIKVFGGDEKLTTALLDRLADHATVIATKGKSFRMRQKTTGEEKEPGRGQSLLAQDNSEGVRDQLARWVRIRAAKWVSFRAASALVALENPNAGIEGSNPEIDRRDRRPDGA